MFSVLYNNTCCFGGGDWVVFQHGGKFSFLRFGGPEKDRYKMKGDAFKFKLSRHGYGGPAGYPWA